MSKHSIGIKLSDEEYAILERIAKAHGITVSTLITRFIYSNLIFKTIDVEKIPESIEVLKNMIDEEK